MSNLIQFPQGPIVDQTTGYVSIEWSRWFQNPQVISIIIGTAIGVESGGTGLTSGTSGGILGFTGTTTIASSGVLTNHSIVVGGGAGATPSTPLGLGTTATVLHGNAAGAPSWGAVVLTADVSGVLPVANGGTGVSSSTGTTNVVLSNGPTLVTPVLGDATATTINKVTITAPASNATLSIANGKTLTASNSLTLTGTDGSSVAFGTGGTVAYTGFTGTVTSVAASVPVEFSISGSPITTSGTLAITKATQSANIVWAGPTTGAAAQPTFRALVAADMPASLTTASGTWTPIDSSGAGLSFTSASGKYTQIGKTVWFSFQCAYPATASGANALIGGLPSTSANTGPDNVPGALQTNGATAVELAVNQNATNMSPQNAATGVQLTNAQLTTLFLRGSGFYFLP